MKQTLKQKRQQLDADTEFKTLDGTQGEDSDVRERVHVSTMDASSGDDLYSVFSLEYKVPSPRP